MSYLFAAPLWRWDARTAEFWTFVSLPEQIADEILEVAAPHARGFGSVRVEVTVGATTWRTSIFPSSSAHTYVLPIKRAVRSAEGLGVGTEVSVRLVLVAV